MELNRVRTGVKITPDVINKIIKLYFEDDLTMTTIGKRFGVSYGTIYNHILEAVKDDEKLFKKIKENKYRKRGI